MKKLTIGLDFDGVINDHYFARNKAVKELFDINLDFRKTRPRDIINKLKLITYEQYKEAINKASLDYSYIEINDASFYIKKLIKEGFSFKIISNRNTPERNSGMENFLEEIDILKDIEIVLNDLGEKSKASRLKGLDVFVDDVPEQTESATEIVSNVFLFTQEYSIKENINNVKNISSWEELYREILKIN